MNIRHCILDTETTGLLKSAKVPIYQQPHIVEIGFVMVEHDTITGLIETSEHNWLVRPPIVMEPEVIKIHGITNEQLAGERTFGELFDEFAPVMVGADTVIAHNLPFDSGMFNNEAMRIERAMPWPEDAGRICSVQEFMYLHGRRMKLVELYEHFCGKPLAQTHRAVDDCRALYETLVAAGWFQKYAEELTR